MLASDENEIFYQEQHVKEKEPSIDIHEEISFHQLADVIREGKREVDQQPASTFHSPVLATDIQPYVSSCKEEQVFCYQPSRFYHLFYDPVGEYMELHFLNVLKPPRFILPSSLGGNLKNVINLLSQFHCLLSHKVVKGSQDDQVLCCTETSKHNIQSSPFRA
jgi:hypothetical protein